jgi:hypothetical protein
MKETTMKKRRCGYDEGNGDAAMTKETTMKGYCLRLECGEVLFV